ncbi:hypothetical protein M9Y10_040195 [Tritrichomonas musculus]|uniref:Uncharacterized protein n=1 Tax=Tritrichomonas musculus TaxID=1915356 RepID=A0ABR2GQQ9_9EUKA
MRSKSGIKVVFVGSASVGKSCIFNYILKSEFDPNLEATLGSDTGIYNNPDLAEKDLLLTDTAGQEKYKSLLPIYFRGAVAAIIVYSIDIPESLKYAEETYEEIIDANSIKIVYLVENKIDLRNDEDYENKDELLSEEDGQKLADKLGCHFMSVSAKTGHNIKILADEILLDCIKQDSPEETDTIVLKDDQENKPNQKDSFFKKFSTKC